MIWALHTETCRWRLSRWLSQLVQLLAWNVARLENILLTDVEGRTWQESSWQDIAQAPRAQKDGIREARSR